MLKQQFASMWPQSKSGSQKSVTFVAKFHFHLNFINLATAGLLFIRNFDLLNRCKSFRLIGRSTCGITCLSARRPFIDLLRNMTSGRDTFLTCHPEKFPPFSPESWSFAFRHERGKSPFSHFLHSASFQFVELISILAAPKFRPVAKLITIIWSYWIRLIAQWWPIFTEYKLGCINM